MCYFPEEEERKSFILDDHHADDPDQANVMTAV
jgi:hypothetical protein